MLVGLKDQWHGTLIFIAQPAEEIGSGAKACWRMACSRDFRSPISAFALHANGAFAYGTVLYRVGIDSPKADGLYIKFCGRGGHGAVPQANIDPVMMAGRLVVDAHPTQTLKWSATACSIVTCWRYQHQRR
jgi:hippurate hydrolase